MKKEESKRILNNISSHICGLFIVSLYFGEQIKILNIPLYCYFLVLTIFLLLKKESFIIRLKKINISDLSHFSIFLILCATVVIPIVYGRVGTQPYFYCVVSSLIIFVISNYSKDDNSIELLANYAFVGLILTCVISTYELITHTHFIKLNEYYARMGIGNAFGFQVNINDNASLIAICLFSVYFVYRKKKILSIIIAIWSLCLIQIIDSRLVLLSIICTLMTAIVVIVFGKILSYYKQMTNLLFFLGVGVIVLLFISFFSVDSFIYYISDSSNYKNDFARVDFMESAIKSIIGPQFLFGNGAGVTVEKIGYSIHSLLVELLCDYGIFVFVWFMYFLIKLILSFSEKISVSSKSFITSFTVAFILISFCSSSMLRIRPIWMMFSLVWNYYRITLIGEAGDKN